MADGDMVNAYMVRDNVETVGATTGTVCSQALPTGTEGFFTVWAIVHATEADTSDGMVWRSLVAQGIIDGGAVSISGTVGGTTADLDPNAKGWTITIDEDSGAIRVRGTGAAGDTVRWHGRMWIDVTELVQTGG